MASIVLWLGNIFTVITFVMTLIIIILAYTLNINISGVSFKMADLKNNTIQVGGKSITLPINTASLITKSIVVCALSAVVIATALISGEVKKNKKIMGVFTILLLIGFFISLVILFIEANKLDYNGISELKYPVEILKYSQFAICCAGAVGFVFIGMSSLYKLL